MKKVTSLVTLAALAMLSVAPARAATTPPAIPTGIVQALLAVSYLAPLSGASLTPVQSAQIMAIEIAGWKALIPQIIILVDSHEAIIGELAKPTVSVAAIKLIEKKKLAALTTIETARITMAIAVQKLLTPAQITAEAATHVTQLAAIDAFLAKLAAIK